MPASCPVTRDLLQAMLHESRDTRYASKRVVLFIAVLAGFITPFDGSAVNVALPSIAADLHLDAIQLSWVATGYLLASALFLVPFGKIADIYGRKKIFLYGIAIFSLSSLAMTLVISGDMLLGLRVVQGLGSSLIFGTSVAILTSVFSPGERGKALGIYITSVYLGLTVGPFIGGTLTGLFGWRSIFLINVPIGIFAIALVLTCLKGDWADSRGEPFDLAGSLLYSLTLVAVMVGFGELPSYQGLVFILAGTLAFILFVLYERKQPYPVMNISLFSHNRVFAFSSLAALINYSATYAVSFLLSLYLQYTRDFSPQQAGLVLILAPVSQMVVSPFAGRLSDKTDPQLLASVGMGCSALGIILLAFVSDETPLWFIMGALIVLGFGFGLFTSPNTNAIMSSVEKKVYGVASGVVSTMRLLGQMFSMGITMTVLSLVVGKVEITPEYDDAISVAVHDAFLVFAVLCGVGIIACLIRSGTSLARQEP